MNSYDDFRKCEGEFSDWWISQLERFQKSSRVASSPFTAGKELSIYVNSLGTHCEILGWCGEILPIAEDFRSQALALAMEELAEAKCNFSEKRFIAEGRIHNFDRVGRSIERLSSSVVHRMEALRTIISTEKERFRQESFTPRN